MHEDLCLRSGCMHVLRHGVLMLTLLGILKVFQMLESTSSQQLVVTFISILTKVNL
jgi:hypothetical protein